MTFEIKAEYEFRTVLAWHVVRRGWVPGPVRAPARAAGHDPPVGDLGLVAHHCQACEAIHSLRAVLV